MRYRTIVADPPWEYDGFGVTVGGRFAEGTAVFKRRKLPYASLSVDEICSLPVEGMADSSCRLFLWTTNRYLPASFGVLEAWGFRYAQSLVWHKTGNPNPFVAHIAPIHHEFLIVGAKGKPARVGHLRSSVFAVDSNPARLAHSQKPEAFLDHIESVSPGPYLELFARRQRLGWDTWGDEALAHVELSA